tara:strand:- start:4258 stop:4731 length:474 start_codon:yes stop_codon:yes gene_type:complete
MMTEKEKELQKALVSAAGYIEELENYLKLMKSGENKLLDMIKLQSLKLDEYSMLLKKYDIQYQDMKDMYYDVKINHDKYEKLAQKEINLKKKQYQKKLTTYKVIFSAISKFLEIPSNRHLPKKIIYKRIAKISNRSLSSVKSEGQDFLNELLDKYKK